MEYEGSELLAILKTSYKIEQGDKLTFDKITEMIRNEKIEIKDLRHILQINYGSWYKLWNGKQQRTKMKFDMYEDLNQTGIFEKGEITYNGLMNLKKRLNIKIGKLKRSLGIYSDKYKKLKNGEVNAIKVVNMKLKHIVNLIKFDMKYLTKYGEGYYKVSTLTKICEKRNINFDDFVRFYNRNPKCYDLNKLAIKESNYRMWIGGERKLSDEFIIKYYNELRKRITKLAYNKTFIYNCRHIAEDLIDETINEIYMKHGNIEKIFYFNDKLILNILTIKAKFFIINMCKKECKNKIVYV